MKSSNTEQLRKNIYQSLQNSQKYFKQDPRLLRVRVDERPLDSACYYLPFNLKKSDSQIHFGCQNTQTIFQYNGDLVEKYLFSLENDRHGYLQSRRITRSPFLPPYGCNTICYDSLLSTLPKYHQIKLPESCPSAQDGRVRGWMINHIVAESCLLKNIFPLDFSGGNFWDLYLTTRKDITSVESCTDIKHSHVDKSTASMQPGFVFDLETFRSLKKCLLIINPTYAIAPKSTQIETIDYLCDWLLWSLGCTQKIPKPKTHLEKILPSYLYHSFIGQPAPEEYASCYSGCNFFSKILRKLLIYPYPYFSLLYDEIAGKTGRNNNLNLNISFEDKPVNILYPRLITIEKTESQISMWDQYIGCASKTLFPICLIPDNITDKALRVQSALYTPWATYLVPKIADSIECLELFKALEPIQVKLTNSASHIITPFVQYLTTNSINSIDLNNINIQEPSVTSIDLSNIDVQRHPIPSIDLSNIDTQKPSAPSIDLSNIDVQEPSAPSIDLSNIDVQRNTIRKKAIKEIESVEPPKMALPEGTSKSIPVNFTNPGDRVILKQTNNPQSKKRENE